MNSSVGQTLVPVAIFGKAILTQTLAPVPIKDHSVYGKINFSLKKSKKQKKIQGRKLAGGLGNF